MPDLLTAFAIIGVVLMLAALTSGIVERTPVSFPMIFLGLGFLAGGHGLNIIRIGAHDPTLETVSTISLAFVLFLDAVNLRFDEIGNEWVVPALSLGPGTLLTILFASLAAYFILKLAPIQAFLLGSIIASVDPVLLRDVFRDERLPRSIRESLKIESGSSDVLILPIVLVLATVSLGQVSGAFNWFVLLVRLFFLGPLVGFLVGLLSVQLIELARKRTPISREYRALYGVGTVLVAYFIGQWAGESGFLAVFAAGSAAVAFDYDLCDCFLDYGEVTSEMAMLLAFLLFGALLSDTVVSIPLLPTVGLALFLLFIARPIAINLALMRTNISRQAKAFIGWFGPRGLSTLLFGLLLVTQGVPGSEQLLSIAGGVVIISVVLHGISTAPLINRYNHFIEKVVVPEEREGTAAGLFHENPSNVPRITPAELMQRLESDNPPVILDVRTRSSYEASAMKIPGSIRVLPDEILEWATNQPHDRPVVTYCT
jgi:NhaP-type Na+/H+ or K+/H+ antiporter